MREPQAIRNQQQVSARWTTLARVLWLCRSLTGIREYRMESIWQAFCTARVHSTACLIVPALSRGLATLREARDQSLACALDVITTATSSAALLRMRCDAARPDDQSKDLL